MAEEMNKFRNAIIAVIGESLRSNRWEYPDHPGSAHIKELSEYIGSGDDYSEFRKSEAGAYYLQIVESLQLAFNDDWLPFELFGLELARAREFLRCVRKEVEQHDLEQAVPLLRAHYHRLKAKP
jgi:hypothetical protein